MEIKPVAVFRSPFTSKFGIPKQSGLVKELEGEIVFESAYRNADALRGMDGFDYLWLIWGFSANRHAANSLVVRPPLLGGNEKVGVFATRSPFRPNPLGLSSVRISHIDWHDHRGPVIHVLGADLMDGTPIYDIKPYVPYADARPDARSGFAQGADSTLEVRCSPDLLAKLPEDQRGALLGILSQDPRPHYQKDPDRIYGMAFGAWNVKFRIAEENVTVISIEKIQ